MKRPLAYFGFSLYFSLFLLCVSEGTAVLPCMFSVGSILFIISLIISRTRRSMVLPTALSAVLLGCLLFFIFNNSFQKALNFADEKALVEATVKSKAVFDRENESYYCVLKTERINSERVNTKLRLSFSSSDTKLMNCLSGDRITLTASLYPTGEGDEGVRRYYKAKGIYLGGYSAENITVTPAKHRTLGYYIDFLREKISLNFLHDFDRDTATFLIAVLSGDKELMDEGMYESFRRSGIVHIMAVSGLHLSIWVLFLSYFMEFKGRKGRIMAFIMILFVFFMLDFADYTGSVRRAGIMALIMFAGKIIDRQSDSLNSLGFSALCILTANPFSACDISFTLSFLSTAGIIIAGAPLNRELVSRTERAGDVSLILKPVSQTLAISFSVSFFTLPFSLWAFGGFSSLSAITNIMLLPFSSAIVLMTGLYTFLRFVPFIGTALAGIMNIMAHCIMKSAEFIGEIRYSYIYTFRRETALGLAVLFLLAVLLYFTYRYDRVVFRTVALITVGAVIIFSQWGFLSRLDKCCVYMEKDYSVVSVNGCGVLIGFNGDSYEIKRLLELCERTQTDIKAIISPEDASDSEGEAAAYELKCDNVIYNKGASVTLFDKVTVRKTVKGTEIQVNEITSEIFCEEYLQEGNSYDIINGKYVFSYKDKTDTDIIIGADNISIRGEGSWQSLTKKLLRHI